MSSRATFDIVAFLDTFTAVDLTHGFSLDKTFRIVGAFCKALKDNHAKICNTYESSKTLYWLKHRKMYINRSNSWLSKVV